MIILGIETTCDETSAGIVKGGRRLLSNVVSSSAELHKKFGGIVPEVAAREQVKLIVPVIAEALLQARCELSDIDAVSVAHGPGLIGSLLVGVEAAKTLSTFLNKPLIAVNHLAGHVYANWIGHDFPSFPLVALIVSGGHTDLVLMTNHAKTKLLGQTRDDAAGEVFDKVARVLGLGYPGGPEIERMAAQFKTRKKQVAVILPRPMISENNFEFSFSGLKTAVVNLVTRDKFSESRFSEVAYEFQDAIVDVLVKKTIRAAIIYKSKSIVVGGGVAANSELRFRVSEAGQKNNISVFFPTKDLSVDNGAMIATAAFFEKNFVDPLKLQSNPSLHF